MKRLFVGIIGYVLLSSPFVFADFSITAQPNQKDWEFLESVINYQSESESGADIKSILSQATMQELEVGIGGTFTQEVEISPGAKKALSVEITQILISVPLEKLLTVIPANNWGQYLAHYLGGELRTVEVDSIGRPKRQIERMVLSGLPFDLNVNFANQDMTKTEILIYGPTSTAVFWKVYHSDNDSTLTDLGKVEFRSYPQDSLKSLVTFYSAHKIQALGVEIPSPLTQILLKKAFLDHLKQYKRISESKEDRKN